MSKSAPPFYVIPPSPEGRALGFLNGPNGVSDMATTYVALG